MLILLLAFASDILDGYIARSYNLATPAGYFIDGIGDKVVYIAILLVIFREDQTQTLLPWLLIAREIILYALRAIEGGSVHILETVRMISLTYAFFIRLYFLGFFVACALPLYNFTPNKDVEFFPAFGYAATVSGFLHIVWLTRLMAKPT